MKKISFLLVFLISLFFDINVFAFEASLSFSCDDISVNATSTCKILVTSEANLTKFKSKIETDNFITLKDITSSYISFDLNKQNDNTYFASFDVIGSSVGKSTINLSNIEILNELNEMYVIENVNTSFNITDVNINDVTLDSLKVDDYNLNYENGSYYVRVLTTTESVNISALAQEGISIIGLGKKELEYGKNEVELILSNSNKETKVVKLIIERPENRNSYNTKLKSINILNYDIKFKSDKFKYKINIPKDINEIYVYAESDDDNLKIDGLGIIKINDKTNEITISSTYENSKSEYTIVVNKYDPNIKYYIVIGISVLIIIGLIAIIIVEKIKFKKELLSEKNKIMADANRLVNGSKVNNNGINPVKKTLIKIVKKVPISNEYNNNISNNNINQ